MEPNELLAKFAINISGFIAATHLERRRND